MRYLFFIVLVYYYTRYEKKRGNQVLLVSCSLLTKLTFLSEGATHSDDERVFLLAIRLFG